MASLEASKINHENHLLLDQPLVRLPYELLRKNFRSAHFTTEKDAAFVKNLLRETAKGSVNAKTSPDDVVKNLDIMIKRLGNLKDKLSQHADEESHLYRQLDARVAHLAELSTMHTVEEVKYETWSRRRLDRLMVDYLLRHGYNDSAKALADERDINDLVDIDTFVSMSRIRTALENGSVTEALAWCTENKKELRRMQSNLEFLLRCQQYIEMLRTRTSKHYKPSDAIAHAKKFIAPFNDTFPTEVIQMAGLLAHLPTTDLEPYHSLYSSDRWSELASAFVDAHNRLLNLPPFPLLHIALSSGLSALKTPACHGPQATSSSQPGHHSGASIMASVCPICSTELNALARGVPYAQHSKSHVESDLFLLPSRRVYGKARLEEYAAMSGLPVGQVKDLVTGEVYGWDELKKVFVS
ncbi:CTLH/CRA C-terminal to lish motif domain-containing protein [Podospora conica]|nr:CTLH/CRA C-terminal to lish motif domain-containing protein [Schizothecium conicum]